MEDYKQFVREHPAQVKRMEEMGRLAAMFLPVSKFGNYSEVVQESTYSILGLTSLFHDRIISKAASGVQDTVRTGQEQVTRYIRIFLTLFSHVEVVIEMLARITGGDKVHLRVVYLVECLKALGRLVLLAQTRAGKLLVNGGQYQAAKSKPDGEEVENDGPKITEIDSQDGTINSSDSSNNKNMPGVGRKLGSGEDDGDVGATETGITATNAPKWQGKRSGKTLDLPGNLRAFDNVGSKSGGQAQAASGGGGTGAEDSSESKQVTSSGPEDVYLRMLGEVLHIVRPVLYVAALERAGLKRKPNSWTPFFLSLVLELVSLRCASVAAPSSGTQLPVSLASLGKEEILARALKKLVSGPNAAFEESDVGEIRRRRGQFALYAMRSPLFDKYTLPLVQRMAGAFSGLPGIGESLESMLTETVLYYHRNHFYNSAS